VSRKPALGLCAKKRSTSRNWLGTPESTHNYPSREFDSPNMIRKNRFRPCDVCRSRKTRCHPREGGACEYCTLHRKQCTFKTPATRRRASESNATIAHSIEGASIDEDAPESAVPDRPTAVGASITETQHVGSEAKSLGFSHDRFAELYGLSSDMEPILMVSRLERRHESLD